METSDTPAMESGASTDPVAGFEALLSKSMGEQAPPPEKPDKVDTEIDLKPEGEAPPEEQIEDPEKPKTYKVKVDGQEIEVAEDELLKGYSRQADYTKKTMALAAEQQHLAQVVQQVQAERQQHQTQLNRMAEALGQQLQAAEQIDWQQLIETDPVEYLKQQHLFQKRQTALIDAQRAQAHYAQQTAAQQAQARQQELIHEQELLLATLPDWKDQAKASQEKKALADHLVERGYTKEQVAQLTDHKTVLLAREAMLYRQMVAKAKETVKTVEKLPPRMEKPGTARSPTDGRTALMQNLKKSGSTDAAAAMFERLL